MARCLVVAEAGNNHEGRPEIAFQLLEEAKKAGADLVKFQAGSAEFFARHADDKERYMKYELGLPVYRRLVERGREIGIDVFFSVWGGSEFDELMLAGNPGGYRKIAARQCVEEYIKKWDSSKTLISIPHNMSRVEIQMLGIVEGIPLHCVTEYPTLDARLYRIEQIMRWLGKRVGYSDHTVGIDACVEAAKMGACIVEKHFTLAHDFGPLRDHALSATPKELGSLVDQIRSSV